MTRVTSNEVRPINIALAELDEEVAQLRDLISALLLPTSAPSNPTSPAMWYDEGAGKIVITGPGGTETWSKD